MSYSIIYRRNFIKLNDNRFIPMVEIGESNVFDVLSYGKSGRRSRDWEAPHFLMGEKYNEGAVTLEWMLSRIDAIDADYATRDGYTSGDICWNMGLRVGSKNLSTNGLKTWIKNACKDAVRFDELGTHISIKSNWYWEDNNKGNQFYLSCSNEEEYLSNIAIANKEIAGTNGGFWIKGNNWVIENFLEKKKRNKIITRMNTPKPTLTAYWVVSLADGSNFSKFTSRRMFTAWGLGSTKKFRSEKEANKVSEKIKNNFPEYLKPEVKFIKPQ